MGAEIPSKALLFDFSDRQYYVYLERAEGQYVRQQVVVREESGSRVVVESGLKAGDKVVSVGALLLDAIVHQSR
jgi:cobalt-zinc-cadmium efflux system membrane fusion protein